MVVSWDMIRVGVQWIIAHYRCIPQHQGGHFKSSQTILDFLGCGWRAPDLCQRCYFDVKIEVLRSATGRRWPSGGAVCSAGSPFIRIRRCDDSYHVDWLSLLHLTFQDINIMSVVGGVCPKVVTFGVWMLYCTGMYLCTRKIMMMVGRKSITRGIVHRL